VSARNPTFCAADATLSASSWLCPIIVPAIGRANSQTTMPIEAMIQAVTANGFMEYRSVVMGASSQKPAAALAARRIASSSTPT
jgi:hypothetical protein